MRNSIFSLPRTVWLLGLVSLFNDGASELVYAILPLFIAGMAGPGAMGIIEGVAEATGSLLKLFSGMLSDRLNAGKGLVVGGYGLASLAKPLMAFAASWPVVLFLRFADRLGKGLRTSPRDAMLALSVDKEKRGLAFGFHRSMDNAGAVFGPLMAAYLLAIHVPIRHVLLWSAIPGAIAVSLALFLKAPERAPSVSAKIEWSLAGFSAPFRRYLAVLALFTLGNSSNLFLLLRAKDLGLQDYQVPLLWALVSFSAMLFSTPFSALSDRIGRARLIIWGWVIYGLFYLVMGFDGTPVLLWPLFAFYGLFMAATEGAEKAYVADFAPTDKLGTAYGWFNLVTGFFLLPASLFFGWFWQHFSYPFAFAFSAGCALLSSLLLKFWVK
jgi:MFS family permease